MSLVSPSIERAVSILCRITHDHPEDGRAAPANTGTAGKVKQGYTTCPQAIRALSTTGKRQNTAGEQHQSGCAGIPTQSPAAAARSSAGSLGPCTWQAKSSHASLTTHPCNDAALPAHLMACHWEAHNAARPGLSKISCAYCVSRVSARSLLQSSGGECRGCQPVCATFRASA